MSSQLDTFPTFEVWTRLDFHFAQSISVWSCALHSWVIQIFNVITIFLKSIMSNLDSTINFIYALVCWNFSANPSTCKMPFHVFLFCTVLCSTLVNLHPVLYPHLFPWKRVNILPNIFRNILHEIYCICISRWLAFSYSILIIEKINKIIGTSLPTI